jgi:hypothetical protein
LSLRRAGCIAGLNAGVVLALASACSKRTAPPLGVVWSEAAPGLDTAQIEAKPGVPTWAVRYDQRRFGLSLQWSASGQGIPGSVPGDAVAAINGGYFEPDLRPSGLLIVDGRQVQVESGRHGALLLQNGHADIVPLRDLRASPTASALQAWPFLIEPGGADGIRSDDHKTSRRSAFGLDAAERGLLVAVPTEGVSLFELMEICRRLGAVIAVNLDGGPSTGFALGVPPRWSSPTETEVSNLLVLRRLDGGRANLAAGRAQTDAGAAARSTTTHAL